MSEMDEEHEKTQEVLIAVAKQKQSNQKNKT